MSSLHLPPFSFRHPIVERHVMIILHSRPSSCPLLLLVCAYLPLVSHLFFPLFVLIPHRIVSHRPLIASLSPSVCDTLVMTHDHEYVASNMVSNFLPLCHASPVSTTSNAVSLPIVAHLMCTVCSTHDIPLQAVLPRLSSNEIRSRSMPREVIVNSVGERRLLRARSLDRNVASDNWFEDLLAIARPTWGGEATVSLPASSFEAEYGGSCAWKVALKFDSGVQ